MKNICIALFLTFLCFSCNNPEKAGILLFNGYAFSLLPGEKTIPADSMTSANYNKTFNSQPGIQIPLYKVIAHPGYRIFIGIPYNTPFKRLKSKTNLTAPESFDCRDTICLMKYNAGPLFITEFLLQVPNQKASFYATVTTNSQALHDSLFTRKNLAERFTRPN